MGKRSIDQHGSVIVAQRIEASTADPTHAHQRVVAQNPQLVGDRGLLHPDGVNDLRHGPWSGAQRDENLEPARC